MFEFPYTLKSCRSKKVDENLKNENKQKKGQEVIFTNYIPKDKEFRVQDNRVISQVKDIEKQMKLSEESIIKNFLDEEKQPLNIIPKRSNVDLKKHLAKKYDKLNKRTELAIIELLKKKFQVNDEKNEKQNNNQKKVFEKLDEMQIEMQKQYKDEGDDGNSNQAVYGRFKNDIVYDIELQIQDDIQEEDNFDENQQDGSNLVQGLKLHENQFQNIDDDSSSESEEEQ